jgi:hypothetical protein
VITFAFQCPMTPGFCPGIVGILVLALLGAGALLLFKGRATRLVILLVLVILGICVVSFVWGPLLGGPTNWDSLKSVATLLAVGVALLLAVFHDDLRNLLHHPNIAVRVDENLMKDWDNKWWIRGEIKNDGDRPAKQCRVKLLRIEGEGYATERPNAYLRWEGRIGDFMTLYPDEYWIFDIGTRDKAIPNPPLHVDAYIAHNPVTRDLAPRGGGLSPAAELRGSKSDADAPEAVLRVRNYALCSRKAHHPQNSSVFSS